MTSSRMAMYWSVTAPVEAADDPNVTEPFMETTRLVADKEPGEEPSITVNVRLAYPVTSEVTLKSLSVQDAGRRMATGAVAALAILWVPMG